MLWRTLLFVASCAALLGCDSRPRKSSAEAQASSAAAAADSPAVPVQAPQPDPPQPAATPDHGLVIVDGSDSVSATIRRLKASMKRRGLAVMAVIDHGRNADKVGLRLPPTKVILFGKPEVGTKLMRAERTVAIDLPQRMLVWRDADGATKIAYHDPRKLLARHGARVSGETIGAIAGLLDDLATGRELP